MLEVIDHPRFTASQPQGLGSWLSRNLFANESNHRQAAGKIEGLKGYITQSDIQRTTLNDAISKVGAAFPAVVSARPAIDRFGAVAVNARALVAAAQSEVVSNSYPSDPPPAGTSVDDWRQSWFIDLDALNRLLAELDEARYASSNAINSMLSAVTRELAARGERTDVMQVPKTPPAQVNWNLNNLQTPDFLKPLAKAFDSVGNLDIGGGLTKGLTGAVAIGGVVLVLWLLANSKGGRD